MDSVPPEILNAILQYASYDCLSFGTEDTSIKTILSFAQCSKHFYETFYSTNELLFPFLWFQLCMKKYMYWSHLQVQELANNFHQIMQSISSTDTQHIYFSEDQWFQLQMKTQTDTFLESLHKEYIFEYTNPISVGSSLYQKFISNKKLIWFRIFVERYMKDKRIKKLMNKTFWNDELEYSILKEANQMGIDIYEMLHYLNCTSTNLTVQYYSTKVMKKLHGNIILHQWKQFIKERLHLDPNHPKETDFYASLSVNDLHQVSSIIMEGSIMLSNSKTLVYPIDKNTKHIYIKLNQIVEECKQELNLKNIPLFSSVQPIQNATLMAQYLEIVNTILFRNLKFGPPTEYYNPNNCFVDYTLQSKVGIPITLSAIYMYILHQLHIVVLPIGMPFHFIVGIPLSFKKYIYVDPFHGTMIQREECRNLLLEHGVFVSSEEDLDQLLRPISPLQVFIRMLSNIFNFCSSQTAKQSPIYEYMPIFLDSLLLIQPEHFQSRIARLQICLFQGDIETAQMHLNTLKRVAPTMGNDEYALHHFINTFTARIEQTIQKRKNASALEVKLPQRKYRFPFFKFKFGDVVYHNKWHCKAVVAGYEYMEEADPFHHPPNHYLYFILIDSETNQSNHQDGLVAESDLISLAQSEFMATGFTVKHTAMGKFFTRLQHDTYIANARYAYEYPELPSMDNLFQQYL